jgi:hypothetical protein
VKKFQTRFEYLVQHRESFKFLAYTPGMNKLRLIKRVDALSRVILYQLSEARKWLAKLPEQEFPGKTKREDYEIVRIKTELFELKTQISLEKKTNKKGRKQ